MKDGSAVFPASISTPIILSASVRKPYTQISCTSVSASSFTIIPELPVSGWMPNIHKRSFLLLGSPKFSAFA